MPLCPRFQLRFKNAVCLLFILCFLAGENQSVWAWQPYAQALRFEDSIDSNSPPIEQSIVLAGIRLLLDRTQLGSDPTSVSDDAEIARLKGKQFTVTVLRLPNADGLPLQQLALQSPKQPFAVRSIRSIHRKDGMQEVKAIYGRNPTLFSNGIREIRYYFTNLNDETICFAATGNRRNADWDYFHHLMQNAVASSAD